ncbi:conserved hypothetical protein [Leishmania major strain Friedlin]|uniref:Flagellar attachment zone protein 1 conserved domain-containing protein n=1 Tax=Leishmania major TaxID=5664 RepID=Q4Q8Z4_LEIMA|nr:conserved hypothetical protein [Leishmania major strain Friedlin]CAG9576523.1 hypothetical_protein_-_conserved [Leishmania major strain Friedlin]CAJ05485.1 conserved hypothetical protein [Leishmania major strain Friedlin]|eukprot:XP_001684204.1 conserved hypothetical protein [Leishmania major strain Friedlin]
MSRRESCIWHPMPEEVRRSSVQSRRASLAAGRRKSLNVNGPDWDVEAPPTPCYGDYSARGNAAEAHTLREAAAPLAESSKKLQQAHEAACGEVSPGTVVVPSKPMEDDEAFRMSRTRHTVRFHGEKWAKVLRKRRDEIIACFVEDIRDGASVMADEARRLKIRMNDCMEVTFITYSGSRARQKAIHMALQQYSFPKTCQRYTTFEA